MFTTGGWLHAKLMFVVILVYQPKGLGAITNQTKQPQHIVVEMMATKLHQTLSIVQAVNLTKYQKLEPMPVVEIVNAVGYKIIYTVVYPKEQNVVPKLVMMEVGKLVQKVPLISVMIQIQTMMEFKINSVIMKLEFGKHHQMLQTFVNLRVPNQGGCPQEMRILE